MILMDRGQFICKWCNFSIRLMVIKYWLVKQLNIFWSKNKMVFAKFFLKFGIQYALYIIYILFIVWCLCILCRRLFIRWRYNYVSCVLWYIHIDAMFLYDIMIVWGCFCGLWVSQEHHYTSLKKNHPPCHTSLSPWFWLIIKLMRTPGHRIV